MDEDVISSGSPDLYAKGRQLRKMQADLFDDPKGISTIMDSDGPKGMNRKVPFEEITGKIASMPVDQMHHVIGVLRAAPEELQPQAQAAIQSIQGHFVGKLVDTGTKTAGGKPLEIWNAPEVAKFISQNNGKLSSLFSEDQVAQIAKLRDAGNVLSVNPSYPGASAQAANAVKRGMMTQFIGKGATLAGGGIGGMVGAPGTGAVIGNMLGEKVANRMGQQKALKNFTDRLTKISDVKP